MHTIHPNAKSSDVKGLIEDALFNPDRALVLTHKVLLQRTGHLLEETYTSSDLLLNIASESDPVERARLEIAAMYAGGGRPVRMLQFYTMGMWHPDNEAHMLMRDYLLAGCGGRAQAAPPRQRLYDSLVAIGLGAQLGLVPGEMVCPAPVVRDVRQRAKLWGYVYDVLGLERAEAAPFIPWHDSPALHTVMWPVFQSQDTSCLEAQLLAAARTVAPNVQRLDDVLNAL